MDETAAGLESAARGLPRPTRAVSGASTPQVYDWSVKDAVEIAADTKTELDAELDAPDVSNGSDGAANDEGSAGLGRFVGLLVIGVVAATALLLWFAIAENAPIPSSELQKSSLPGLGSIVYDKQAPQAMIVLGSVGIGLLFAIGVAVAERVVLDRSRRSVDVVRSLAPKVVMQATRGVYAGPVTVTVLIPAHNEAASIGSTLDSLRAQVPPPDRIIVIADNCNDGTEEIATSKGVEVFTTVANTKKKAGGLNQVLGWLLTDLGDNDVVMCMDADTMLDDGFLAAGVERFTRDRALMAVGGLFYGEQGHGLLGQLQRNEYVRYSREIKRRRGRVFVLTGTASMFRSRALRTVALSRGTVIPGSEGDVYDTAALTEDNELTLAIKSLGGLMVSPQECRVVTELMPSVRNLWTQRLRWQRGALENIGAYGLTPTMLRYWAQQLGIGYSVIALASYWFLMVLSLLSVDRWIWFPFWLTIGGIFILDRVTSAWSGGWRARVLASLMVPELLYDMFLDFVYVKGIIDITFDRQATWGHVVHVAPGGPLSAGSAAAAGDDCLQFDDGQAIDGNDGSSLQTTSDRSEVLL